MMEMELWIMVMVMVMVIGHRNGVISEDPCARVVTMKEMFEAIDGRLRENRRGGRSGGRSCRE